MKTNDAFAAYRQALIDHQAAVMRFDQADPTHTDAAIYELKAAEERVRVARQELSVVHVQETFGRREGVR